MFRFSSQATFFIFDHSTFDVERSMFILFSKPPEGPDVSWLDKSSSHESTNVCVCLRESVANDPSSKFVVLRPCGEYQY
jgi:hypothetical protein